MSYSGYVSLPKKDGEGEMSIAGKVRCGQKHDTKPGPVKHISIKKTCKWCHSTEDELLDDECTTCFEMRSCMIADLSVAESMLRSLKAGIGLD